MRRNRAGGADGIHAAPVRVRQGSTRASERRQHGGADTVVDGCVSRRLVERATRTAASLRHQPTDRKARHL